MVNTKGWCDFYFGTFFSVTASENIAVCLSACLCYETEIVSRASSRRAPALPLFFVWHLDGAARAALIVIVISQLSARARAIERFASVIITRLIAYSTFLSVFLGDYLEYARYIRSRNNTHAICSEDIFGGAIYNYGNSISDTYERLSKTHPDAFGLENPHLVASSALKDQRSIDLSVSVKGR